MEPWLDSLSEDWNSEPRISSPASSLVSKTRNGTRTSTQSPSRIPHLAESMRKDSATSSFLKPRSSRGIAKASNKVLSERSASSLNLPPSSPFDASQKRRSSTLLPRRSSSSFSESQSSVQRHTLDSQSKTQTTPEWKKRLAGGAGSASEGLDLFSPSKLEGMFTDPPARQTEHSDEGEVDGGDTKPWSDLEPVATASNNGHFSSYRLSRPRAPFLEALHEETEDEEGQNWTEQRREEQDMSAISSSLVRRGSMNGLVKQRITSLQQLHSRRPASASETRKTSSILPTDPRTRTFSGQVEIRNEIISPVTASATNTIRERALKDSVDLDPEALKAGLAGIGQFRSNRPSSRSSDHDVSYAGYAGHDQVLSDEDPRPEITSVSLPEDLSMGTQDFAHPRKGVYMHDIGLYRKQPVSKSAHAHLGTAEKRTADVFRSSPPPYDTSEGNLIDHSRFTPSLSNTLDDSSVVRHSPSPTRPSSRGSPLKLFGNRDTYTNNKLLRVLSQYEQDRCKISEVADNVDQDQHDHESEFRMSQFGQGELDSFHFEKEIDRPHTAPPTVALSEDRIFAAVDVEDSKLRPLHRHRSVRMVRGSPENLTLEEKIKRVTPSPAKDRTPKRRRTLLKDEVFVEGADVEIKVDQAPDTTSVAGKKRKDARPGEDGGPAGADVLANRNILQPRAGSRNSSVTTQTRSTSQSTVSTAIGPSRQLATVLAAELANFAQGAKEATQDSRKPSLATKDYMEEANKVMELIRARGKPKSNLPGIREPSELDPDSILDVELDDDDDDSTKESFSRPPSRDRPAKRWEDRRVAKHAPHIANQLRQYQEPDDLDLLTSTSVIGGSFKLADNCAADEAALVPVPEGEQESSPPNIRILNTNEKLSEPAAIRTVGHQEELSYETSSRRTFTSGSSHGSGQKGIISSGVVSIPEIVGTMTFDRDKQIWVKQQLALSQGIRVRRQHETELNREATLDDDPFEDIPDLSIDEQREAAMRVEPRVSSRPSSSQTTKGNVEPQSQAATGDDLEDDSQPSDNNDNGSSQASVVFHRTSEQPVRRESSDAVAAEQHASSTAATTVVAQDEIDNNAQRQPAVVNSVMDKQARVVTIAFSSPVASAFFYPEKENVTHDELDDEDFLPPEDSDYEDYVPTPRSSAHVEQGTEYQGTITATASARSSKDQATKINTQLRSIEETERQDIGNNETSLVRTRRPAELTPRPDNRTSHPPASTYKGTSMLCLTPLSEFTMHQADHAKHGEQSFVAARPHPKALLQAHGTLTLSKDEMVKAITDAAPSEPFWEQLRKLDLGDKRLTSLDSLQRYCPALEWLKLNGNQIAQLNGLPSTLRGLEIQCNRINDFTSWSHLGNLQKIDVSNNELQSLDGFSSLCHLRRLAVRNNKIGDIEGIFDLDGLTSLDLSDNELSSLDFEGVDLLTLEELNLSGNRLEHVHNLHHLSGLRKLYLDGNNLKELFVPCAMPQLQVLSIAHNNLELLDLAQFPSLEVLIVDDNRLKRIVGLAHAQTLRKLSAREQRQSPDIVATILTTPIECEEIYLSCNSTSGSISLPPYPHYNLRHLELACCGLKMLPAGFGDYFPNCRTLNLNFNALQDLSPMIGSIKLQQLLLGENRIRRLRRTCLTLARLPSLRRLDIRDNPLTVGFYPPKGASADPYQLAQRNLKHESSWLDRLDETTNLRRRTISLLLAGRCGSLQELDGANFDRGQVLKPDAVWSSLMRKGVLKKGDDTSVVVTEVLEDARPDSMAGWPMAHEHERSTTVE